MLVTVFFTVFCLLEAALCVYVCLMFAYDIGAAVAPSQQGIGAEVSVSGIFALSQLVLAALDSGCSA